MLKAVVQPRIQRGTRRLRFLVSPHALVLMYHRVIDLQNDPYLLAVKPERFAEHMEVIRKLCLPISLHQLVADLRAKKLKRRAVVVTFDDGYADNLYQAKPILERYEIPATVFVTAGQLGSQREFWWDELDRLLLQPGKLPGSLNMRIHGGEVVWDAGDTDEYTQDDFQRFRDWHIELESEPYSRHRLFRALYKQIHSLDYTERQRILDELLAWSGASPTGREPYRCMTAEEAILLERGNLIEVGAHTMFHSNLADLPPAEQRQEIQQSKDILTALLKRPVRSFAFPYGAGTAQTITIVGELGFESACATHEDVVWRDASRYQLPRLGVRDWDRQQFTSWLSWWLDG